MTESRWAKRTRVLAEKGDATSCARALDSEHCPADVVVTLLGHASPWVRGRAWAHPNLPLKQMQEAVGRLPDPAERRPMRWSLTHYDSPYLIIHNPNLPTDLVEKFPEEYAIAHPNCSDERLLASMEPTNPRHRQNRTAITKNHGLSENLQLSYIIPDLDTVQNRTYLAGNPALTPVTIGMWASRETHSPILRDLLKHKNTTPELKKRIIARLHALTAATGKPMTQVDRAAVARYSTDVNEILTALTPNPARTTWIPAAVLNGALRNPSTPTSVVSQACNSSSRAVRNAAAKHPNCTEEGRVIVGLRS